MSPALAGDLAEQIARLDPWRRLAISSDRLGALFLSPPPNWARLIALDRRPVGAVVVQRNWLLGPYLQHLSVLPEAQRQGVGKAALTALEDLARTDHQTNIWLCVSAFNTEAQAFYRRYGFSDATTLPDLIRPGEDEILMRRRLAR